MKHDAPTVHAAIGQTRPFRSSGQEAFVALLLAAEVLRWKFAQIFAAHGKLTFQQYNVLRILRGAGEEGLPTLEIGARMIEHVPGITRLLDRLETKGLVTRGRTGVDRRHVLCRLTTRGRRLLEELDAPVDDLDENALGCLSKSELATLTRLLNRVRTHRTPTT